VSLYLERMTEEMERQWEQTSFLRHEMQLGGHSSTSTKQNYKWIAVHYEHFQLHDNGGLCRVRHFIPLGNNLISLVKP
jgi:hypothetical protein